jgi:hypothetical protein
MANYAPAAAAVPAAGAATLRSGAVATDLRPDAAAAGTEDLRPCARGPAVSLPRPVTSAAAPAHDVTMLGFLGFCCAACAVSASSLRSPAAAAAAAYCTRGAQKRSIQHGFGLSKL